MTEHTRKDTNKKQKILMLLVIILVIGGISLFSYMAYNKTHISTDDASVDGNIYTIAPKIPGTVKHVYVQDNSLVKKGSLLLEIEPVDYRTKVDEGTAGISATKAKLAESEAGIEAADKQVAEDGAKFEAAKANLELQQANFKQYELDLNRDTRLFKEGALSKEKYENAQTGYAVAKAQVKAASEQMKSAELALDARKSLAKQSESARNSVQSSIKQQEAFLTEAQLNLGYTKIYATADGYITKKSVQEGNQVQAEEPLMAVVPLNEIWITANYKETQLERMKKGQAVKIRVDTYPGITFTGRIESIMAGTGASFSLFPPENATGNFVKVVQRIPVKIVLDSTSDTRYPLRIGMSVIPTVLVNSRIK